MTQNALMEVRATLLTTTHTTGSDSRSGVGGVEIQKFIDKVIAEHQNKGTDVKQLISRKPLDQAAYIWNIRSSIGHGVSAANQISKGQFYSEGAWSGTLRASLKKQLVAPAKAYRADYEVSGLMQATAQSYYNALDDEAQAALDTMDLMEERAIISGSETTNGYGISSAYDGFRQLMGAGTETDSTLADTNVVFGITRAAGATEVDVSTVNALGNALSLANLDKTIQLSDDAGARGNRRIFLCSTARANEINQLLQSQQRFVDVGTREIAAGFVVTTYRGIPIVGSRFMDKSGINSSGADTATDLCMYLLDLDHIEMRIVNGVDRRHVPIMGESAQIRSDVVGGYFKTYGVLVMRKFNSQVLLYGLAAPS